MVYLLQREKFFHFGMCKMDNQKYLVLKSFLEMHVPKEYKVLDMENDQKDLELCKNLMYCYEEVFDYATSVLAGYTIDINSNFIDMPASALCQEFIDYLLSLKSISDEMEKFCDVMIETIHVLLGT